MTASNQPQHDNYHAYYQEKIWEMIPAYYRHEDGIAANPDTLRGIVEIVAREVARVRRSHDQLWQDQGIEQSQEWVVPYIGDLLATRLLPALNKRGRRVDVAKTIYYRRRKGTLGVLEELISDITGWEGKVVESFRRLARTRHGLDPVVPLTNLTTDQNKLLGPITGTPQGGTANLRNTRGQELQGGPFDEFFRTPDFRQHRGRQGRYNIPKLAFHLYRLQALPISSGDAFRLDDRRFSFDPSGREVPLFSARHRADDWHNWETAQPWSLPAPIACRLLNHTEFIVSNRLLIELADDFGVSAAAVAALATLQAHRHPSEDKLRTQIERLSEPELLAPAVYTHIVATAMIEHCGKVQLWSNSLAVYDAANALTRTEFAAADLSNWPVADPGRRALVDPRRGILQFFGSAPGAVTVDYHYGNPMGFGAGSHDRTHVEEIDATSVVAEGASVTAGDLHNNGVTQFEDNKTHDFAGNKNQVVSLGVQAANFTRPYLRLPNNWVLRAATPATPEDDDAVVTLDGLWFGSIGTSRSIVLRGNANFERVTIRHSTLDPGGSRTIAGAVIEPVTLVVECQVEKLIIEKSVLGRIEVRNSGFIEEIEVIDSVIDVANHASMLGQADPLNQIAINAPRATLRTKRSTIFGGVRVNRLWASDTLMVGQPHISDTQTGCFRFSAAPLGARLPRPYESHFIDDFSVVFSSTIFGQPNYAQLSESAPSVVHRGGENGADIGVFNALINPIKLKSLESKVSEYMPFGLIPLFINES